MFERMIVAFDGSDTGLDGLVLSMGLAKAFGSQVTVVYVYDEELSASSRQAERELAQHANAVLDGARERVSQALAMRFCALPASSPAQGLHQLARSDVGCQIARFTSGTLEVVTTTSASGTLQSLEDRARRAVGHAVETIGSELEVTVRARVGNAAEELVSRSSDLDLIVLGSRGYGPPRTMQFGSVSSQVVPEAQCPVMILAAESRIEPGI
jgi:nucleotide-binding universal stress UspA family protein